ncbi:MAG: ribonucleoside-diphosphate reductase beta chain [Natronomonas sp.]|jgi:ribonucleoside-diphosphate reductase beta chain|uniref:ribonucleotide-diphosphate reductase subunit beta n=1 Tax=Natronomonas sp. TaxID=2184060 RepID=UPI003988D335
MALDYADPESPFEWYRAAKEHGIWDPESFDLEQDKRDWEEKFDEAEKKQFMKICSLFYEGEESVTKTLAPYPIAVEALEDPNFDPLQEEMYLTTQLWEETKHTDFFSRYFDEVFDTQDTDYGDFGGDNFWNPELQAYLIDDLEHVSGELRDAAGRAETAAREGGDIEAAQRDLRYKLGDAVMHYMGMVEAQLAETGYSALNQMLGNKDGMPAFQAAMTKIQKDEARHINNGRWLMKKLAQEDPDIVPEVYEPHVRHFEEELSGPTIQNLYVPNPLDIDMQLLVDESLNYMQSHFEIIGEEKFSEEFRADYIDIGDAELQARILEQIQAAA